MAPVIVIATLRAREDCETQARAALEDAQRGTHEEAGCRLYALHVEVEDPRTFVLIEHWDSQEALDVHGSSPHITALGPRIAELCEGRPVVTRLAPLPLGAGGKGEL